ncbi:MAG: CDP-glycerol glycerophosphotransferase family protein [Candidatus Cloacimonetes bacterium]|nr:CDP-glycerol glycerophosphotransferase family protein [Candidatus Cloacimonadota bacterium]
MVFSYYIKYPFYNVIWHFLRFFRKRRKCILYCEDAFDIILFKNVGKYLENIEIVAKNKKVKNKLESFGYQKITTLPSYPDAVIMFRNMAWKFPCKKIKKIGFKHGAFNFKKHSNAKYYNMFNLFFLTSQKEIDNVRALGVNIALETAYPKIDDIASSETRATIPFTLDYSKKTLFFASTWDGSGMSAIEKWYEKVGLLKDRYNILVSVHEWMSEIYKKSLRENASVFFIDELDRLKYINLADICICDTSSMIAEICLLDKPLITFRVKETKRTLTEVINMIEKISIRIDEFEELEGAIKILLDDKNMFSKERKEVSRILFDSLDGNSGKRAAEKIKDLLQNFNI